MAKSQIAGAGIPTKTIYYEGSPVVIELNRLVVQRRADILLIRDDGDLDSLVLQMFAKHRCAIMLLGQAGAEGNRWRRRIETALYVTPYNHQSAPSAKFVLKLAGELDARLSLIRVAEEEGSADSAAFLSELKRLAPDDYTEWRSARQLSTESDMGVALKQILEQTNPDLLLLNGGIVAQLLKSPKKGLMHEILERFACPVMLLPPG